MRKVILYISASLDGYIAKPNDDLSFLSVVEKEGEDYGYNKFTSDVDTVIMGRKTFDWVYNQLNAVPHPDKETFIVTKTARPNIGKTVFYTGNFIELVKQLKNKPGKNIYCDGGAELLNSLLQHKLIDELIISVVPVMVGNGTRLFKDGRPEQKLKLWEVKSFDTGLVQLHYQNMAD